MSALIVASAQSSSQIAVSLADLRARGVLGLRADGSPYPLDEQPLARARSRDERPSPTLSIFAPPTELSNPFMMTSLPFFNPDGELIGVGNYVTAARAPADLAV